jgi:hypothetical protein
VICRVRTINLVPAKASAAREVARRAAAYATEHFSEVNVEILENIAGPQHQMHMVTRCESLAALEAYETKRQTDAGWQALVEDFQTVSAAVDTVDYLYRTAA